MIKRVLGWHLILLFSMYSNLAAQSSISDQVTLEDFEAYEHEMAPTRWKRPHKRSRSLLDLPDRLERDQDYVEVFEEGGNKVLRVYTKDDSEQIVLVNGASYNWDLTAHPVLSWRWKAKRLPAGAREDSSSRNDSGAALYVTFDSKDWLGRPRTIKYVYSTILPEGQKESYGSLKILVVSSGLNKINQWTTIERNVRADYEVLFGREAPARPAYIMIWSDSDNTGDTSEVFFDDITIKK